MERLRAKARHDEAQALYHAKQEGISEQTMEIARIMLAKGEPVEHIMKYTGLNKEDISSLTY